MKNIIASLFTAFIASTALAQNHKGISLQLYIMKQNGQPMNQSQLSVRTRVLSTNDCVLIDETHSNIDIVNGYMRVAVGSGVRGGADKGLSLSQALSNASPKSNLDHISGTQGSCSVTPASQDPRKLKVTFSLGSENVEANFTVRSSAYAVVADEAQTLNGKASSEFLQKNDAKNLSQSKLEEFFEVITTQVNKSVKFDGTNFVAYEPASGGGSGDLSGYLKADGSVPFAGNLVPSQPDSYIVGNSDNPVNSFWGNVLHIIDGGQYRGSISGGPSGVMISSNQADQSVILQPNGAGTVDVSSHRISNVAAPVDSSDAATKGFVESLIGSIAPSQHTHSADDINSGTISSARLPIGTTAGTVAAGNDSRFSDARTPLAHSHAASDLTGVLNISQGGTGNGSISGRGKLIGTDLSTGTTMTAISCALNELLSFDAQGAYQCISTANFGTVKSVVAGTGLSGGTITESGTLSVNFGNSAGTVAQGNDARFGDAQKIQSRTISAAAPTNGQTLVFNSATSQWEPQALAGMDVPAGTIIPFVGATCPSGYLLADGSTFSSASYPALATVLGSTTLPKLQGLFLRGAGSQVINGVTYSTTLGQTQADMFQGHEHEMRDGWAGAGTQIAFEIRANSSATYRDVDVMHNPISDGVNGNPRFGSETRPANYGVNYCIKAANTISTNLESEKQIRATVGSNCTTSSCNLDYRSPGAITGINRTQQGQYKLVLPSGVFSAPPTCVVDTLNTVSGGSSCIVNGIPTATEVNFYCHQMSNFSAAVDTSMSIICMGPR